MKVKLIQNRLKVNEIQKGPRYQEKLKIRNEVEGEVR